MSRCIFLLISSASLYAQTSIEFEGRYWFTQLNSRFRVDSNGLGTDIDARKDLGFTDSNFPDGRVAVHWGHNRLAFGYTPIDFSGDQTVSRTLFFNGRTYTFGTRVESSLEVRHLQLGWTYQFRLLNGIVKLGPLVEAHGFLLSGRLHAPDVNVDSREDLSAGLPAAGLALEISPVRQVDIYGEASGLPAGGYGHFIGSEAGVRIRPIRYFYLTAGYRTFNLAITNSPDFASLHLRGPFIGGGFRW